MEVSSLINFTTVNKQITEKNEESKGSRTLDSTDSQGKTTDAAQTSLIPPVNQITELSSEEGNKTTTVSESSQKVDILA